VARMGYGRDVSVGRRKGKGPYGRRRSRREMSGACGTHGIGERYIDGET